MQDLCPLGGEREDDFDAGRKRGWEAPDDLRAEVVFDVIEAIDDQNQRMFGRRHEGEEGGETFFKLK